MKSYFMGTRPEGVRQVETRALGSIATSSCSWFTLMPRSRKSIRTFSATIGTLKSDRVGAL